MKGDVEHERDVSTPAVSKWLVGHFVRRQGQFGTVSVVARRSGLGVEPIPEPKRLFPRDGCVETQGINQHAGIHPGDWLEFDVAKNQRFRAPEWKVVHLKRIPRFAVLLESSMPGYRVLLTREGWTGDHRPGLWAFRLTGDMVLVAELELGKDKRLRLGRASARDVKCFRYHDDGVVRLSASKISDDVYILSEEAPVASFDWSDEADHIGRVVRSLAGAGDPRVADIIAWLELHHEAGTGKVSAASGDKEQALEALRSGALAARLHADRELMETYLAAALQDDGVRNAVAAYAREGHGAEWDRLRAELSDEVAEERVERLHELAAEIEAERIVGFARLDQELERHGEAGRETHAARWAVAEREATGRIEALETTVAARRAELERDMDARMCTLTETTQAVAAAEAELAGMRGETEDASARLGEVKSEIDRLLGVADRLKPIGPSTSQAGRSSAAFPVAFPEHPLAEVGSKVALISRNVLLSDPGKEVLESLLVLFLSGELPILVGDQVSDLLRVAETVIAPGRMVSVEADPTLISIDDLWSRPGSGMPTLLATAADAAKGGGAVIAVVRGIERSGARFWMPALAEALRGGTLPRGLFVCCTVVDREHDEIAALPSGVPWLEVADAFRPEAYSAAPTLLSQSRLALESLVPGPIPMDLSAVTAMTLGLEQHRSVDLMMRTARMFAEAIVALGDEDKARRLVARVAQTLAPKAGK